MNVKEIIAAETIAQELEDNTFTANEYESLRKQNHLPSLSFVRKHGIVKVANEVRFTIKRNGEEIEAKRFYYVLNKDTYKEIMAFNNTRTGLKKLLKRFSYRIDANNEKIKSLTAKNAEYAQFLNLMGQW